MAKKVFIRIWRTFIILVNTLFNLIATLVAFVYIFDKYAAQSAIEQVVTAFVIIMIVNLTDFITRKHFKNY